MRYLLFNPVSGSSNASEENAKSFFVTDKSDAKLLDLTLIKNFADFLDMLEEGDEVTVFGGDDGTMLEELARRGETINYEIPCILTPRVPRIVRE